MKTITPPPTLEDIWQRTLGDKLIAQGSSPEKFRAVKSAWLSGILTFHEAMFAFGMDKTDVKVVRDHGIKLIDEATQLIQSMAFRDGKDN